jgi:ankyrin repeat protein
MNMQNTEGFTPLLYATYNGHMDIIKYLVEDYAVNDKLTTKTGLNPLHLAAQKNMVLPFIYFINRIDIN